MSSLACEELYRQCLDELLAIWKEDVNVAKMKVLPTGRQRYEQLLLCCASLYVQYLRTGRRLAIVHDTQLQPQKRYDVRTLLDACMARMLELRAVLSTNCGEFVKLDECILDLKMTPDELEVPIPRYFVEDNASVMQERRRQITSLQQYYKETDADAPVTKALVAVSDSQAKRGAQAAANETMSLEEAVMILKVNERGRQARQRAKFQLSLYAQKRHAEELSRVYNHPTGKERAATVLQSAALAYLTRKHIFRDHHEELQLLGMAPSADSTNVEEAIQAEARLDEQKARQRMNEARYRQKTVEMENRIKIEEGPRTMELMLNEALTRMAYARLEGKDDQGMLQAAEVSGAHRFTESANQPGGLSVNVTDVPHSPMPNVSGTFLLTAGLTNDTRNATRKAGSVTTRRRGEEDEMVPAMPPSVLWDTIRREDERYNTLWKPRFQQTYVKEVDLDQPADLALLRQQLLEGPRGVMEELRLVVDELILMEVENLKKRLEQERRSGKRKGAKKKGPKKPRALKLKDPTKGATVETMMNAAIYQSVLKLPDPDACLEGFLGCFTVHESPLDTLLRTQRPDDDIKKKWQRILNNWDSSVEKAMKMKKDAFQRVFDKYLQQSSWMAEPTAAHVRQSVTEYAILPLGSQVIHDLAPSFKTLLLYGFHGTGKTHLVHAICNHSSSNFFDLSPTNFESDAGLAGLIQTTFYLAKVMAPSVIYIDGVEKLFLRKKRKGPKDPLMRRGKRMKKEVLKGITGISPTDRVMVIGSTCAPYDAEFNALVNNFSHMVYCGCPDYASRIAVLQELLRRHAGDSKALKPEDYHELALLTDGFTCGDINTVFGEVLTKRRLRRLEQRPLTADDFLLAVTHAKPPNAEDRSMMKEFTARLPLHLRRVNPITDIPVPERETVAKKKPKKRE